jgi:hypothetical protein
MRGRPWGRRGKTTRDVPTLEGETDRQDTILTGRFSSSHSRHRPAFQLLFRKAVQESCSGKLFRKAVQESCSGKLFRKAVQESSRPLPAPCGQPLK